MLSVGLPIGAPVSPRDMRGLDFLENMLPEGPALERMAALAGVRPVDTYGILRAFGRDCAGAIMVLPDGEQPGGNSGSGYTPITPTELRQVLNALDATPLAAAPDRGFRPSLPGLQRKALLGRAAGGIWQLPRGDAPSTWILKPDGPHRMAANEATCLWLAVACGLEAADAELLDVAGLAVLAVRRYDRRDVSGQGHSGPGAPGGWLPGDRHASRAEIRGAGRPVTARLRRPAQELRRPPRRDHPAAPHDVQHGRRQRGRARQELLRAARSRQSRRSGLRQCTTCCRRSPSS